MDIKYFKPSLESSEANRLTPRIGHPERVEAELRAVLPPHVISEVDWSSLRREPGSVVDPELCETASDLLFTARLRTGRSLLLYVLLEHQSSVDRWLALRDGRSGELAHRLPQWTALFAQVHAAPEGSEHLVVVIRYLLWIGGNATRVAAGQVLHSVMGAQQAEALMGSWAEELIERGVSRGRAEYILRVLAFRGVHVDEGSRQRILECTEVETLDRWFDRALQATTLSDVLDDGAHAS